MFMTSAALETLAEGVDKIPSDIGDVKETAGDYLKQEWGKMLGDSWIGGVLNGLDDFFTIFNPVWNSVLGVTFSLSWVFILTFAFWILFLVYAWRVATVVKAFMSLKYSSYYKWGIWLIFFVFISSARFARNLANWVITFIEGKGDWQVQFIAIIIILGAIVYGIMFSKVIESWALGVKKERRFSSVEKNVEKQKDVSKKRTEKIQKINSKQKEDQMIKDIEKQAREDFEGASE